MSDEANETLDQLAEAIANESGRQLHPEHQELILERLDAPGEHTIRLEWTDDGELQVVLDGIEVARL